MIQLEKLSMATMQRPRISGLKTSLIEIEGGKKIKKY